MYGICQSTCPTSVFAGSVQRSDSSVRVALGHDLGRVAADHVDLLHAVRHEAGLHDVVRERDDLPGMHVGEPHPVVHHDVADAERGHHRAGAHHHRPVAEERHQQRTQHEHRHAADRDHLERDEQSTSERAAAPRSTTPRVVRFGRANALRLGHAIDTRRGRAEQLPYPDDPFVRAQLERDTDLGVVTGRAHVGHTPVQRRGLRRREVQPMTSTCWPRSTDASAPTTAIPDGDASTVRTAWPSSVAGTVERQAVARAVPTAGTERAQREHPRDGEGNERETDGDADRLVARSGGGRAAGWS